MRRRCAHLFMVIFDYGKGTNRENFRLLLKLKGDFDPTFSVFNFDLILLQVTISAVLFNR